MAPFPSIASAATPNAAAAAPLLGAVGHKKAKPVGRCAVPLSDYFDPPQFDNNGTARATTAHHCDRWFRLESPAGGPAGFVRLRIVREGGEVINEEGPVGGGSLRDLRHDGDGLLEPHFISAAPAKNGRRLV